MHVQFLFLCRESGWTLSRQSASALADALTFVGTLWEGNLPADTRLAQAEQ